MSSTFKYIFFIFLAGILFACSNHEEEEVVIPDYVLSEDQYAKLLVDFSLAESAGNLNIKGLSGLKFDSAYAFDPLKENKIDPVKYDSSISFYGRHPKLYKKIFEEVLTTLSKMQASRAVKKDSTLKKDSLLKTIKSDSVAKRASAARIGEAMKNAAHAKITAAKKDSLAKSGKAKKLKKKKRKKK